MADSASRFKLFQDIWRTASYFIVAFVLVFALTNSGAQDIPNPTKNEPAKEAPTDAPKKADKALEKAQPEKKADSKTEAKKPDSAKKAADSKASSETARLALNTSFGQRVQSLFGLFALLGICALMSRDRKHISVRVVVVGILLQITFGFIVLKTKIGESIFDTTNVLVTSLIKCSDEGAKFLFGRLIEYPFAQASFGFSVLPTIIFFSSFMTVLYHLGVMQFVVKLLAKGMQATMKTSGAETLSAAGNIFVGQTEAPLLIKPYVNEMTESELMAVMTGGFATVAGGVMAAYVTFLKAYFPDIAGHLLTASVMSAPAALVCAKIMVPEVDATASKTYGKIDIDIEKVDSNIVDAAARGASEGLQLALNVGAMLIAFLALVYMVNSSLEYVTGEGFNNFCLFFNIHGLFGVGEGTKITVSYILGINQPITLQYLLGVLLAPVAWLMGVDWADCTKVGSLLGQKTVLNEFVAYQQLAESLKKDPNFISPRSMMITTYALCGFANFASVAIQVGGISVIAPDRRQDLAKLGFRAMIAGTLAAFMTGTVAGMIA